MKKLTSLVLLLLCMSTASFAASPSGTTIPSATQIVDSTGGVWTLSGGVCYSNGVQAAGTVPGFDCAGISLVLWLNGRIYVFASVGTWWTYVPSGPWWTEVAGDPRGGPSANGTTIPSATQIVDARGDVWTLSGGVCYSNGVQAAGTVPGFNCAGISLVLWFNGQIYVFASDGTWWTYVPSGPWWTEVAGDPRGGPSANGATIPPSTQIVDAAGGVWTLTGGVCYRNSVKVANCTSVQELLFYNSQIYVEFANGTWWIYNGSGWTQVSGNPEPLGSTPVITYHYDTLRTGWNKNEITLTAANFPSTFQLLHTVTLDDQVDAQPLVGPAQTIAGSTHDVVYVATESNTIYGIDASSGAILLQKNLGTPVPAPFGCGNNGPNIGINSTPVIDLGLNALYVIAYVNGSSPTYQLHALNLKDLSDKPGSPVTVAAAHKMTDGSTFTFNANYQRQRPALLELEGNIYAGFGSFCDFHADQSRGWLLGWNATTLTPLPANRLDDTQATSPTSFFLSSIWMSGYGIAGTGSQLYFATGNSDCNYYVQPTICPAKTTYDGTTNIQESVASLNAQLGLVGTFTPSNVAFLDSEDVDLGSGGVLLLPSEGGGFPNLAVAGGKDGRLFLLNRDAMQTPGLNSAAALDTHQLSASCWCGPSFFTGSDGSDRVVTSYGGAVNTWRLQLSPSPMLIQEGTATIPTDADTQDPGFFTVVSSNGTKAGSGIIWAVGRPTTTTTVTLYAFAATVSGGTYSQLFSSPAGSWPYTGGNANIVPVVAKGKVYVASYRNLQIFGTPSTSNSAQVSAGPVLAPPLSVAQAATSSPHQITGVLIAIKHSMLTIQTRAGKTVSIDASEADKNKQVAFLKLGTPYTVQGSSINAVGMLQAISVSRAKNSRAFWPSDR